MQAFKRQLERSGVTCEIRALKTYRREYLPNDWKMFNTFKTYRTRSWVGKFFRIDNQPLTEIDYQAIIDSSNNLRVRIFLNNSLPESSMSYSGALKAEEKFAFITENVTFTDILRLFQKELSELVDSERLLQEEEDAVLLYTSFEKWEKELKGLLKDTKDPKKIDTGFQHLIDWLQDVESNWESIELFKREVEMMKSRRILVVLRNCIDVYQAF